MPFNYYTVKVDGNYISAGATKNLRIEYVSDYTRKEKKTDWNGVIHEETLAECTVTGERVSINSSFTGIPVSNPYEEPSMCSCGSWESFRTGVDIKSGPFTTRYPSGQIKEEGNYAVKLGPASGGFNIERGSNEYGEYCRNKGLTLDIDPSYLDGPYTLYAEDGTIIKSGAYVNGEFVPSKEEIKQTNHEILKNSSRQKSVEIKKKKVSKKPLKGKGKDPR